MPSMGAEPSEPSADNSPGAPSVPAGPPAAAGAAAPQSWPPPPPGSLKVLGFISIGMGAVNALLNIATFAYGAVQLWGNRGAEPALVTILIVGGLWLALALALILAGVGMVRGRLWGRKLGLVFGFSAVPMILLGAAATRAADNLVELQGGPTTSYNVLLGGGCFLPVLACVLVIMLLTGSIRQWARLVRAGPGGLTGPASKLSILALISLVLSFMPGMLLTQLAAVVVGIIALVRISRSGGTLKGRGLAVTGICIASTILAGIGFGIYLMLTSSHPH